MRAVHLAALLALAFAAALLPAADAAQCRSCNNCRTSRSCFCPSWCPTSYKTRGPRYTRLQAQLARSRGTSRSQALAPEIDEWLMWEEMAPAPAPGDMEGSMPPESSPTDEQLIEELFDEDTYEEDVGIEGEVAAAPTSADGITIVLGDETESIPEDEGEVTPQEAAGTETDDAEEAAEAPEAAGPEEEEVVDAPETDEMEEDMEEAPAPEIVEEEEVEGAPAVEDVILVRESGAGEADEEVAAPVEDVLTRDEED